MRTSQNESGRSLIEMLGTIAIITMITLGGIAAARAGLDTYRSNAAADQIEQIAQGIIDLYSWKKDFDGVGGTNAFWVKNCGSIQKPCTSGTFTPIIGTAMTIISKNKGFKITVTRIPSMTCRSMLNKKWAIISTVDGFCPVSRFGEGELNFIVD